MEGGLKMERETELKQDIKCEKCGHDIDNHTYTGCLVKGCNCKVKPSEIAMSFKAIGGKG